MTDELLNEGTSVEEDAEAPTDNTYDDESDVDPEDSEAGSTDQDFDDSGETENTKPTATTRKDEKTKQTKQVNKFYKEQRLQKSALEDVERKAYQKGLVEAVNGINPYTDEEIKDDADVQEYLTMREIEKAGRDPITDYHDWVKDRARKENTERIKQENLTAFIDNDKAEFSKKYPDINIANLVNDEDFVGLFGDDIGKKPLASLYEKYSNYQNKLATKAKENAENQEILKKAKEKSSVGNVGNGKAEKPKSVNDMTDKEFEELVNKVKRGEYYNG